MTMSTPPSVPTVGEIARRLHAPVHKIEYILRARNIKPISWAGNARVYSEADVARIAAVLREIAADRGGCQ